MSFYLIAPFLMKRSLLFLLTLLLFLILGRVILLSVYLPDTYFTRHHLFFLELPFFISGALSYIFYKQGYFRRISKFKCKVIFIVLLGLIVIYPSYMKYKIVLYAVFPLSIPYVYELSKNNKWDRFLGELSYPIYLNHMLVISVLGPIMWKYDYQFYRHWIAFSTLLCSALLSIILHILLVKKVEKMRDAVRLGKFYFSRK